MSAVGVDLNEPRHGPLLGAGPAGLGARSAASCGRPIETCQQTFANGGVRDLAFGAVLQTAEVGGPGRVYAYMIPQELFVEILNETGISAGECRRGQCFS